MNQLEQKIAHLQHLRAKHRKSIGELEKQIAIYVGVPPVHLVHQRDFAQEQLRQVEEQIDLLKEAREVIKVLPPCPVQSEEPGKPHRLRRVPWVIALVALIIGVVIGGMVFSTIPEGGLPLLLGLRATPTTEVLVARVVRTDSEVQIDGLLEEAWLEGDSLTYAVHPAENGSTTATARFLWDDDYLYVGFDVNDTHVEKADPFTLWDGDSVSLILDVRGIVEYRQSLGETLIDDIALHIKDRTIEDDPADTDAGYQVEMRVKWMQPPSPGQRIPADLLSVDHDANPGTKYDAPGTVFSKLSWDGDGDISTARASLLLVDGENSGSE